MARNVVNDYFRGQKRHRFFSLEAIRELVSNRKDPERLAIVGETHDSLSRALAALAERERNIIALKFGAGLKNTEIARVTGVTEDNVGVILYRTLKKLKKELGSVSAYEPEEGRQSIF